MTHVCLDRFDDKPYRDEELLERLYWGEGLSQREIADEMGCTQRTISRYMERFEIAVRDRSVDLDHDRLYRLYVREGLDQYEIADRAGCTQTHVSELMRKYGMDTGRRRYEGPASFWMTDEGYEFVGSKFKERRYYTPIHRLIAVADHGFEALDGKVVHHRNHIPWDNRPSNLELLTPDEHSTHHERDLVWDASEGAFVAGIGE